MLDFPVVPSLSVDQLVLAKKLPLKPDPLVLEGIHVRLAPLILERDLEPLFAVSNGQPITFKERHVSAYDPDVMIWRHMSDGPFEDIEAMSTFLRPQVEAANGLCLCVFDQSSGREIGVVNYLNNVPGHLKIELGNIWYSPIVQRTKANIEATYLMLTHMFGLGYRRLEWKCDAQNERSRRAALRMGFSFEGIQESHMIVKGRNRDTAWFRMLDREWKNSKSRLEELLQL